MLSQLFGNILEAIALSRVWKSIKFKISVLIKVLYHKSFHWNSFHNFIMNPTEFDAIIFEINFNLKRMWIILFASTLNRIELNFTTCKFPDPFLLWKFHSSRFTNFHRPYERWWTHRIKTWTTRSVLNWSWIIEPRELMYLIRREMNKLMMSLKCRSYSVDFDFFKRVFQLTS